MPKHSLWWLITMACVAWYSTVTVYVAIRGIADIKNMLARFAVKKPLRRAIDAPGSKGGPDR
jgi:hypothetical protein